MCERSSVGVVAARNRLAVGSERVQSGRPGTEHDHSVAVEIARRRKRDANDRVGLDAQREKSAPDREPDAVRQPFRPQRTCV